jgi:hypothetical protein
VLGVAALAQGPGGDPAPYSTDCQPGSDGTVEGSTPLPNVTAALEQRKTIRILAIGASAGRRTRGSYTDQIERLLEKALKGINVVMINRGISGELVADAAVRIRNEVALTEPDLVLWQVGTNDALASVPLEEIEETIVGTIRWLREHKVDVVLAGLQYVDRMAQDDHYRAVRELMRKIAAEENVIIVRRYEAMRLLAEAGKGHDGDDDLDRAAGDYRCLAQYFVRAITLGVFGKGLRAHPPRP